MASLATAAGSLHAAVRCQHAPRKTGGRAIAFVAPRPAAARPQQSRGVTSSRTRSLVVASAVQAEVGAVADRRAAWVVAEGYSEAASAACGWHDGFLCLRLSLLAQTS